MFFPRAGRRIVPPILFGLFFLFSSLPARASSSIIIGEVAWAGSSLSTADEWLELWNLGTEPQSLNGWKLRGASNDHDIILNEDAVIPPQGVFLIANYRASDEKSALILEPNVVTTTLSLPNDHLLIQLMNPQEQLVDQAGSGDKPPAGTSGAVKTSMIRQTPANDGSIVASWITALESQQLDENTTNRGTPGFCDGCGQEIPTEIIIPVPPEEPPTEATSTPAIILDEPVLPVTTSSEPIVEPVAATTTLELTPVSTSTQTNATSTDPLVFQTATSTTSTSQTIPVQEIAASLPAASASPSLQSPSAPLPIITVRINEIYPAPSSGSEWIELLSDNDLQPSQLNGWTLEDAVGLIYRFDSSKTFPNGPLRYLRLELSGSHLNNGGDEVILKNSQGQIVHRITFENTPKDQSWIRLPNETPNWRMTTTPTPGEPNLLSVVAPPVAPPPPGIVMQTETPIVALIETAQIIAPIAPTIAEPVPQVKTPVVQSLPKTTPKKTASPKPAPKTPKPVVKKTTAPKAASIIHSTSIPMLSQIESGLRASLSGVVATVPGLLGNNQFILQTEDGRGLFIYGNGKQPSPAFQSIVSLSGTLVTNDSGTSLHMYAQDRWKLLREKAEVTPRTVDLLAPSWEDAWSLAEVTSTVRDVKATYATLDAGEVSIRLQIRPIVHFRTERLRPGDVIRVRGLIDTRSEEPKIIPRSADEITILHHAELAKATGQKSENSVPPWTPLGAAGLTVALAQGYKKVRKIHEQKRLERLLAEAGQQTLA